MTDLGAASNPAAPQSLAQLAAEHGLARSGARPGLVEYLRQLWGRRHFIRAFARARNEALYAGSGLGQLWQVLTPLLNAAVYFLIFGVLLDVSRSVENYPAFLIAGVFIFTFTQRSVMGGARAISGNLGLIRALHFPRASLPLATIVMELQQLLVATVVLLVIVLLTGEPVTWAWLLIVPAMALQTVFNTGLALLFARWTSRIRDLEQFLPFALRTWQYASGVFFSITVVTADLPAAVRVLLQVNPAAVYIELVRDALITTHETYWFAWPLAVAWAVVAFVGGFWYFWRAEEAYGRG
jgi:teichoic acid transport system permease protein